MAKLHLDRLKKKFAGLKVSGNNYKELIKEIISVDTGNVQRKIMRITNDKFSKVAKKYRAREIRMVLPGKEDVFPKHAVHVRKAAESGELISDSLRDQLTKALRERLNTFSGKTGEQSFVVRRGAKAGQINKKLLTGFEQDITDIFTNYTKKDKKIGMPKNIHTIAVTEVRSSINEIKGEYVNKLLEKNPELEIKKKWVQNRNLAKEPREGHSRVNGKVVKFNEYFTVPIYKIVKGKNKKAGMTLMKYPHDPQAPADQVIGCNCDYDIIITKKPKRSVA